MMDCFDEIIKEAATGYIDCDFFMPICFGTKELVNNELKELTTPREFQDAMVPTLIIKNRDKLNKSILKYVELAKDFYKYDPRLNEVNDKEKYIITSLLSNTLVTDFNDIDLLFERHSHFLEDESLEEFLEPQNIGYSETLKSNVMLSLEKQSIVEETPYGINIWLENEKCELLYKFPTIRFGVDNDKVYIYAIQQQEENNNKKIERLLRKTGEGFDEKNSERDPIENPNNLYSVSPWSLAALSIALPIIKSKTQKEQFVAPYLLINRYNAVEISYEILKEKYKDKMDDEQVQMLIQRKEQAVNNHDTVQRNITDKFIRSFRRMDHHFDNIDVDLFPLEQDSMLHFTVGDNLSCNNSLLQELYVLGNNYKKDSKEK